MKARAPGKVVLSGAYAVLEGAPCIVTAVDRYVTADSQRVATHVADEVAAAMEAPFPWVDVSQLRGNGRKLGLGSSAAIVVASLAARHPDWLANPAGREQLYERALLAHRTAQGGGSGVDVAAAVFGGSLNYTYDPKRVRAAVAVNLPDVVLEVWSCPDAASTRGFLQQVSSLRAADPRLYEQRLGTLGYAAERALDACIKHDSKQWLGALDAQAEGLDALGRSVGIPIFTPPVRSLRLLAAKENAVVLPAGAGGGDIALFAGQSPPSVALCEQRQRCGLEPLQVQLGARGVHLLD